MCDLAQMLDEWCVALFGSEETKVPVEEVESKTEEIYGKMVRFYKDFPSCLQVKDNDFVTAPVLCTVSNSSLYTYKMCTKELK